MTAHPRSRISNSACHICSSVSKPSTDHRSGNLGSGNLGRVEGLQDVLRHLENQHASIAAFADNSRYATAPAAMQMDPGLVDLIKRELSDMRFGQTETDRRTQDTLEVVDDALGHVVDRLAMIEGDLRAVRPRQYRRRRPCRQLNRIPKPRAAMPRRPASPPDRPEVPDPAAAQPQFAAAPREFHAAEPAATPAIVPKRAISEILEPHAGRSNRAAAGSSAEAGTRPLGRTASPSERSPLRKAQSRNFTRCQ